jgi:O-antigen biosynthesis protein
LKPLPPKARSAVLAAIKKVRYKTIFVENKKWLDSNILCSVVIPYYNRGNTIEETIDSLQHQTITNFEIIIVNDGSNDVASIQKLDEIKVRYPGVMVVSQKNSGVAVARNNGIELSRGKYILCLDSDDALTPTCIEKMLLVLETSPSISIATTDMYMFGIEKGVYKQADYDPRDLITNNMVITAAMFRRSAWESSGGYTSDIGYEDWEFWIKLAENGHWAKRIPEALFKYRTAASSRYRDDKAKHKSNYRKIKNLHPNYGLLVNNWLKKTRHVHYRVDPSSALINLSDKQIYKTDSRPNVVILMPWMTFGGAETLVNNFCNEIYKDFDLTFMTGLDSENEWEYKFQAITERIYHINNIISDKNVWVEFLSNYIETRNVKILHIIHNGFVFEMLPEIKKKHPDIKVVVTMFNDRVEYFEQSVSFSAYVDIFTTDNNKVKKHYTSLLPKGHPVVCIPNGIDSSSKYNKAFYDRSAIRNNLGIEPDEIVCLFVGRLSEEKNPNVFVGAAKTLISSKKYQNLKFYVIGDGPMHDEIVKAIDGAKSSKLIYLGYKAEVAEYLAAGDIFVLPSSIEGFPLSLLEAMAMGLVCVASDVGAVDEVIVEQKTGYIIRPAGSENRVVELITLLHSDRKLLEVIGDNARKSVEKKFSSRILGKNYNMLYRNAMSKK